MNSLFTLFQATWPADLSQTPAYQAGNAAGWLARSEKQAATNYPLSGRLYLAKSGWLLLSVPNALVRGVFDAMTAPGAELPLAGTMNVPNVGSDVLNAHISVMTAEEVEKIGPDRLNERGHHYGYSLGPIREIDVKNIDGVSKVWAIQVSSPALAALRKSYGLSPLPKGDHPFHITVAVRRKNVLADNNIGKFDAAPSRGELKAAADLTKLSPKWGDRTHLLAALPKHLTDTQTAIDTQGNVDKEMTDLALIASAWLKSQKQKELLAARLKKFQETASLPALTPEHKIATANPQPRVRVVMPYKNQYLMETLNNSKWPENIGKRRFMGGGIEEGETPEQAAAREMFEELGVKIKPTAFRPLGNDPREGWQHEHYLELLRHKLKPGNFNATVGSDAVVTLSHGLPEGADYMGPDIKKLLAPVLKKAQMKDVLHGGLGDNKPDSDFSPKALAEGMKHEHEHTTNDQIAKEIAKDHLQEQPLYYEKQKALEKESRPQILKDLLEAKEHSDNKRYDHKAAILRRLMAQAPHDWEIDDAKPKYKGVTHKPTKFRFHTPPQTIPQGVKAAQNSVYFDQMKNMLVSREPFVYDHNKPVFENLQGHMRKLKQRGDWILQARRNQQIYQSAIDPKYRHQLAMQAFHGTMPQPSYMDQLIERYGDNFLGAAK